MKRDMIGPLIDWVACKDGYDRCPYMRHHDLADDLACIDYTLDPYEEKEETCVECCTMVGMDSTLTYCPCNALGKDEAFARAKQLIHNYEVEG